MKIETIKSELKIITGLHIGAGDDTMSIGGVDSPVIKREVYSDINGNVSFPIFDKNKNITNGVRFVEEPYIAGSSLKGKIRSLLEHYFELIDKKNEGKVVDSQTTFYSINRKKRDLIVELFGEGAGNKKSDNISRAIFRDCFITKDIRNAFLMGKIDLVEKKFENVINRVTGTTKKGGLREIERVISGTIFDFDISIRIFKNDKEDLYKNSIKLGLKLLELDALGGSGSRGYGRVEFSKIKDTIDELDKKIEEEL